MDRQLSCDADLPRLRDEVRAVLHAALRMTRQSDKNQTTCERGSSAV